MYQNLPQTKISLNDDQKIFEDINFIQLYIVLMSYNLRPVRFFRRGHRCFHQLEIESIIVGQDEKSLVVMYDRIFHSILPGMNHSKRVLRCSGIQKMDFRRHLTFQFEKKVGLALGFVNT